MMHCQLVIFVAVTLLFLSPCSSTAYTSSKFSDQMIPGKGRGLIASSQISRGDVLIIEKPLFALSVEQAWYTPSDSDSSKSIDLIYEALSDIEKQSVNDLHHFQSFDDLFTAQDSLLGRFRTNSLPTGKGSMGLFPRISRLNSECRPNVHYRYDSETNLASIFAVSDIAPGQEINTCYTNQLQARDGRQDHMLRNFGFLCFCPTCMKTGVDLKNDDKLREALAKLEIETNNHLENKQYKMALAVIETRLIGLETLELTNDPAIAFKCLYDGFSAAYSYLERYEKGGIECEEDNDPAEIQMIKRKRDDYLRRASEYEWTFKTNFIAK